jgi:hypothetical protein
MKPCPSRINQSTQKRKKGNTRNKMEAHHSRRPKRANHKGNIKFPNPLLCDEKAYRTRKMEDLLKGGLA